MYRLSQFFKPLITGVICIFLALPLFSQDELIEPDAIIPSVGSVEYTVTNEMVVDALKKIPGPSEGKGASADFELLSRAKTYLNEEFKWSNELDNLQATLDGSVARVEDLKKQLENEKRRFFKNSFKDQETTQKEIHSLQSELDSATSELEQSAKRISAAPEKRLLELEKTQSIEAALRDLKSEVPDTNYKKIFNQAKLQGLSSELNFLKRSIDSVDTLRKIDVARRDLGQMKIDRIHPVITKLNEHLVAFREESLKVQEEEANEALRQAALEDPALETIAAANQQYISSRKDLETQIQAAEGHLLEFTELSRHVSALLDTMKKRLSISGNSPSVGALIQRGLHNLPDMRELKHRRKAISSLVREIQVDLLELELDRGENLWLRPEIETFVNQGGEGGNNLLYYVNKNTVTELIDHRNAILDDLIADKNRYFETLVSIDTAILNTIHSVDDFEVFAVTNSIWIPNRAALSGHDIVQIPEIVGHVSSSFSLFVVETFHYSSDRFSLVLAIVAVLVGIAFWGDRRLVGLRERSMENTHLSHILGTLLFEMYVASIGIIIVTGFVWVIDAPDVNSQFSRPFRETLETLMRPIWAVLFVYRICGDRNLGVLQFGWKLCNTRLIRRTFKNIVLPCIFCLFSAGVIYRFELENGKESGSRIFFLLGVGLSIFVIHKIFHPVTGLFANVKNGRAFKKIGFRKFIYWLLVLWPSFLAVMLSLGYVVGVSVFYVRTIRTLWMLGVLAVLSGIYIRFTRAARLRALLTWRESRRKDPLLGDSGIGLDWKEYRDEGRDLRKILGIFFFIAGVMFIWADTVPALNVIWSISLIQTETAELLNVGQLGRVLVCIVSTILLSVQLPKILQVMVFSNIGKVTRGNRYAVSTLLSYIVIIVGIIWGSTILKVEWSSLQWIFAAVSVGLGFGMKEIFGNLFAGIILLFERPIRVGDVVTIGVNTGKVHRIRIRSTTIKQGDKREVIVPNMDIITGQLVNWTLSDSMTRFELIIGVGMDEDVERVIAILEEEMQKSDKVLEKPLPFAILRDMGPSSLNFCCYAYVSEMRLRKFAKTDIQQRVLKRFRKEGITIPYPIYDVRVKKDDSSADSLNQDQFPTD